MHPESRPIAGKSRKERLQRDMSKLFGVTHVNFPDCGKGFHGYTHNVKTYQIIHFK